MGMVMPMAMAIPMAMAMAMSMELRRRSGGRRTAAGRAALVLSLLAACSEAQAVEPAIALGSGTCGRLQGGVALPCSGPNFEAFARTACATGRNYLHPLVRDTVLDAYQAVAAQHPARAWQYGETGKRAGGRLWPHRTHQNGLAADFFMPVVDPRGEPGRVPISLFNKLGYGLEFDRKGTLGGLRIDWRALGDHLLALEAAGRARGVRIERIIITPDFHHALLEGAPAVKRLAPLFMKREAWVRHDEHYHVDFEIPAALHKDLSCR
ncbi:MAG: penicillin-insensitive murein endopeptidase [Polyangia bacterium]